MSSGECATLKPNQWFFGGFELLLLRRVLRSGLEFRAWRARAWASPAPNFVKRQVLRRYSVPSATWVETGTYLGETARFLARMSNAVITLEPSPHYFASAAKVLSSCTNVSQIMGSSETHLLGVVSSLDGDVCFWLDGHYSGGQTFKGTKVSPVLEELKVISEHKAQFSSITVLVDDVRLFPVGIHEGEVGYPPISSLVEFAESHGFSWTIEHDIFIARLMAAERI